MIDIAVLVVCLFLWTATVGGAFIYGWWVRGKVEMVEEIEHSPSEERKKEEEEIPRWDPGNLLDPYTSHYQEQEWEYAEKVNQGKSI